jgi:F-type H+-transporting ATPase subunit epsilon
MAEDKTIRFVVVTPERQVLKEAADFVVIPAHDGEIGVLSDRAPLMCELGIGQMRYQKAGATHRLFIDGGFAQVLQNDVTVLTANAVLAEEITSEMVTEAERSVEAASGHAPAALEARHVAQRRLSALRNLQSFR